METTFNRDLARGKQHEEVILKLIQKKYPMAYIMEGYFKPYDIWIPEINKSVEVKSDEKSKYTGNIVIEIEFDGKPSALSTTEADWWVIYDGEAYVWFTPKRINDCIIDNNLRVATFVGKGDTKQKKAFLVKKDLLYKYLIRIDM
tara:strand:+ start:852 stop:1286 length:435 start_codon:yes stop_codon:yes gene_type:complete